MSWRGTCHNLKKWHPSSVVVNIDFVALVHALRRVLLHLNPVDFDVALPIPIVVEKETAVHHDRVVQLCDLVGLGQVGVDVVLSIEFYLRKDATAECQRGLDRYVEALFVQDREHAGEAKVDKVSVTIRFLTRSGVKGS